MILETECLTIQIPAKVDSVSVEPGPESRSRKEKKRRRRKRRLDVRWEDDSTAVRNTRNTRNTLPRTEHSLLNVSNTGCDFFKLGRFGLVG